MATNEVYYPGDTLPLPVPEGTKSGDPVVVGTIAGIAMEDRDAAGNAPVRVKGVFKLSVTGPIDVGDKVYYTAPSSESRPQSMPTRTQAKSSASRSKRSPRVTTATIPVALKGGI
ncbi:MAG: DUF2190 family protein [Candidatus Methanoculleus thermohydrogenotrophicum]|nr:DUF2190 family protein [Candidatus Methanoculleus thermohydrogenotrophicum]